MASYTCLTCRVMFAGKDDSVDGGAAELQKAHYKTDWHRYNLKRKVAELPPVTAENFRDRVLAQKEQTLEQVADTSYSCRTCRKHFCSSNAYENHIKSKKHRDAEAVSPAHEEKAASDETILPADVQRLNEKNKELNAKSSAAAAQRQAKRETDDLLGDCEAATAACMSTSRSSGVAKDSAVASGGSMDVDEESEDSDAESWSGDALGHEECLFCPRVSESLDKNIRHMTVDHGFFIPDVEYLIDLEGLITHLGQKVGECHMCLWCGEKSRVFAELKAVQQHMVDKGHCKLFHEGDAVLEYADYYDYRKSYPDYKEGGTAKTTEDVKEEEDEELVESTNLAESGYQLVLPSGATVGHRSLMKYYRQKLRPDRQLVLSRNSSAVSKVISHYKALGWTGTTGVAALTKAKDIAYVRRLQSQQWMQVGVKGNKLQRYFRDQVFGF